MKIKLILLLSTAITFPLPAGAMPPVGALIAGLSVGTGISVTIGLASIAGGGFYGLGLGIGSIAGFLGSGLLGQILINVGLSYIGKLLGPGAPDAPKIEAARVNTNLPDAPRWQAGGPCIVGGHVGIFAEYDDAGQLWYIVAHADAEIVGSPQYYLDHIPVTLSDGTDGFTLGEVITDEFCTTDNYEPYEGVGNKFGKFNIYTVTPDASNVYGAFPTEFATAFSGIIPADFFLTGVCYSVIRCDAVPPEHYGKVFKWRGILGLGEPSVTIYANFNRMYDPREVSHDIDDSDTWTASDGNAAIVWAWWRTNPFGMGFDMADVDWTEVEAAADICDETVLNRSLVATPLYRCGIAANDTETRQSVESQILESMDGYVAYSDTGQAYAVPGYYVTPTLEFTAARDILTEATQTIDDGETPLDGVVINYLSPDHKYTKQPSATWYNTDYYTPGTIPNLQFYDVLTCQDHNQAVRLAKARGQRLGATRKAALGTTVKGVLAKRHRIISLDLDAEFQGAFEIASPVQEDPNGQAAAFAVVPVGTDRWILNEGEEGAPPAIAATLDIDTSVAAPENVVVISQSVQTSSGDAVRFVATFDAPSRVDRFYQFRYAVTSTTAYEYFSIDMDALKSYSAIVADGVAYDIQWQSTTAGGRASGWAADQGGGETVLTTTATANTTPPAALTAASATGGVGEATVDFTTANDVNQASVAIYRGTTTVYGDATLVTTLIAAANVTASDIDAGLASGTYYYWATPQNGSGFPGTESGPYTATVT